MENDAPIRGRGRPRSFDREAAVERAMKTFWAVGYDAASISMLAEAMRIRSASLYAAFGDKAGLFKEAVALYGTLHGGYAASAFTESTARASVEQLLRSAAQRFTDPALPPGCMVVLSSNRCSDASMGAISFLVDQRKGFRDAIKARLDRGESDGEALPAQETTVLADYIVLVFEGLSAAAQQGIGCEHMDQMIEWALAFWPRPSEPTFKKD